MPLYFNQVPLTEVMEPLDFEDVLLSRPPDVEPGPLRDLIEFPADDLELLKQPRECRTTESGVPEDGCVLRAHTHRHLNPSPKVSYSQLQLQALDACVALGKLLSSDPPFLHL